jgi:hypothetical protein
MRVHGMIIKLLRMITFLFGALVGVVVLIGLALYAVSEYQNRHYADDYFSFMNYDEILETRKWHDIDIVLGCTYAIVSLVDASPSNPPNEWIDTSLWNKTPLQFKEEVKSGQGQCRNLICECEYDLSPEAYQRLMRALSEPGSFYYLGWKPPPLDDLYQDVILVYSPTERIAARVRFGD